MHMGLIMLACSCAGQAGTEASGEEWTTPALFTASDVVVIGSFVSTADGNNVEGFFERFVVRTDTSFRVQAVLKGDRIGDTVVVMHYRYRTHDELPPRSLGLANGPDLVEFQSEPAPKEKERNDNAPSIGVAGQYLLFLKRLNDGYVPSSGQMEPCFSFYRLNYVDGG